jgi:predicted Zn-dependent protease
MKLSRKAWILLASALLVVLAGGAGAGWVLYKRRQAGRLMTPEEAAAEGRKLFEARNFLEAFRHLGYASQKKPGDAEVEWLAAQSALQLRQKNLALPHLKEAWDAGMKTPEVLVDLVQASSYKSPDERLKAGMNWIRELPEGPGRKETEGDLRSAAGEVAEALVLWREVFSASPSPKRATKIGLALLALRKPKEAETFLAALRKTPNLDDEGYALLATVHAEKDDRKAVDETFAEGRGLFPASEVLPLNQAIYLLSEDKLAEAIALLDPFKGRAKELTLDARHHAVRLFLGFAHAARSEAAALSALEELAQGEAPWLEGERLYFRALRALAERKEPGKDDLPKASKLLGAHPAVEWALGRHHARAGRWGDAAAAYRNVLGLLARSPILHYEHAQALHRAGKPDEALDALRRLHGRRLYSKASMELFRNLAVQKGLAREASEAQQFLEGQFKDDPGIALAGGAMALSSGRLADAARIFDEMALKHPGNESVEAARLSVLLAKKDYEAVLRECEQSKASAATLARFRAAALIRLNRLDEAEEAFARGLAEKADWTLQVPFANLLLSRQKTDAAAKLYEEVLRSQPRNEIARLGLGLVAARNGRWKEALEQVRPLAEANLPVPLVFLLLGEAELAEGRPDRAVSAANRALSLAPEDAEGHLLLGAALLGQGKSAEAEAALLKSAAKRPDDPTAQWQLARARVSRGAYEEALKGVETALAKGASGNVPLQQVRLVLLAQAGRGPEARQLLERLAPQLKTVEARLTEAWLLHREGQLSQAAELLRPHLDHPGAALFWAEIMLGQGRTEGVIDTLEAIRPDAATWTRLAESARVKDLPALVVEFCRRALKAGPEDPSLLNNLAWYLVQLPSFDEGEAIQAARKATALLPNHPSVLHTHAMVLLKCRKERDCIDLLQRAGSVVERNPKLMLVLAQAHERSENSEKAVQWYTRCLEHPETAAVQAGELSRPALEERLRKLKARPQ